MSGFGGAVKLTGESAYRSALKQITQNLREVSSQINVVSSSYSKNDNSIEANKSKTDVLNQKLTEQKSKLQVLQNQYKSMDQAYSQNTAKHDELVQSYNNEKAKLDQLKVSVGTTSSEYVAQQKVVNRLASEVSRSTTNQEANAKSMSEMRIQMNNAQADINKTTSEIEELNKKSSNLNGTMSKVGSGLATVGKVTLGALAALGTGAVMIGKQALESYANYEQLVGGVDTLFKESSKTVQNYANNAYKTAGLSANKYMETVTSFSASLLQSLNGDTKKSAEYADQAIIDMSDNANKMGTSMEMIQNAYQGFAKQNYTMLDNLKLGYGGTKEEMQRLLEDAEKLTGKKYDISNFADVTQAIHAIQTEMGITGTTAKEASTTIEGSVNSMKSAWGNLLVGIADDNADFEQLISNFVDSVVTVGNNVIPRIKTIIDGIGKLVTGLVKEFLPSLLKEIPDLIKSLLPSLIVAFQSLLESVISILPDLVNAFLDIIPQLVDAILGLLPMLIDAGLKIISSLIVGIGKALPQIVVSIIQVINQIVYTLVENIPTLIESAIQFFMAIVQAIPLLIEALSENLIEIINTIVYGLIDALPQVLDGAITLLMAIVEAIPTIIDALVTNLPRIIQTVLEAVVDNIPKLLDAAIKFFTAIIEAIPTIIKMLIANLPKIISIITTTLVNNLPLLIKASVQLYMGLVKAIPKIIIELVKNLPQIITAIVEGLIEGVPELLNVGIDFVKGIWEGISGSLQWIKNKISSWVGDVVSFCKKILGINSPSKVMADNVGKYMAMGIGEGFENKMSDVSSQMADAIPTNFDVNSSINGASASNNYSSNSAYDNMVSAFKQALKEVKVVLDDREMGTFVTDTMEKVIYT